MTEIAAKAPHTIERERLQNQLAAIDRDETKLQSLIGELYRGARDNPHVLYAAATHLTALTLLERRDHNEQIVLPSAEESGRAFAAYAQLMAMLNSERDAPLYATDDRVRRRLIGAREELAFHATLSYATAQGADFVALPTPASVDFTGEEDASDVQIFFAGARESDLEIQVKFRSNGNIYHPRIAVLNLETALGSKDRASQLRGILREVGEQADGTTPPQLATREHGIILDGAAAIMKATYDWDVPEIA